MKKQGTYIYLVLLALASFGSSVGLGYRVARLQPLLREPLPGSLWTIPVSRYAQLQ